MDKSQLQIILSRLATFDNPDPSLEQYATPADVASDFLHHVNLMLDSDATLIDLGTGTGILAIGAGLLGFTVTGYDTDPDAVATARENLERVEQEHGDLDVTFTVADIDEIEMEGDAVIMNPPFGMQEEDRNLDFLERGFRLADQVFALLHRSENAPEQTRQFIKEFASQSRFEPAILATYEFRLPQTMSFHSKRQERIRTDLYYFTR